MPEEHKGRFKEVKTMWVTTDNYKTLFPPEVGIEDSVNCVITGIH